MSTDFLGLPCLPAHHWALGVCRLSSSGTKASVNTMPFCLGYLNIDKGCVHASGSQLCQRAVMGGQALWMPPQVHCGGALLRVCISLPGVGLCERLSVDSGSGGSRAASVDRRPETLLVSSCPDTMGQGSLAGTQLWVFAFGLDGLCFVCWLLPRQECGFFTELCFTAWHGEWIVRMLPRYLILPDHAAT